MKNNISNNLKVLLFKNNLSQLDFSKKIGIPNSTINSYITRDRNISCENLIKIADFFDVSVDELLGRKAKGNIINYDAYVRLQLSLRKIKYEVDTMYHLEECLLNREAKRYE